MKHPSLVTGLVVLIGLLALAAAGAGLFWPAGGEPFAFTTHRGRQVLNNRPVPRWSRWSFPR